MRNSLRLAYPLRSVGPAATNRHIVHLAIDIFEVHALTCDHSPIRLDKNRH